MVFRPAFPMHRLPTNKLRRQSALRRAGSRCEGHARGWSATRVHLRKAAEIAPRLIEAVETFGPAYLGGEGP